MADPQFATASTVKIRRATLDDMPVMLELERTAQGAAHWTNEQYRKLLDSEAPANRLVLIAETGEGSLIGFLVGREAVSDWELENVVVCVSMRRKGIGRILLNALLQAARQANGDSVFLEVREGNFAARRFYERSGFHQTGTRKGYYSEPHEDAVLYRLDLR